jgi:hypothetical protein
MELDTDFDAAQPLDIGDCLPVAHLLFKHFSRWRQSDYMAPH